MKVATRVSAEGAATICKTITTVIALQQLLPVWPVVAFGVAQLSYAFVYFVFLYAKTWSMLTVPRWGSFEGRTCYMTLVFTLQGLFKHVLTEGDKIVLTALSESYDQGVYAMGSSYGGLAARIILQPLEENARLLWSRLQSTNSDNINRIEQSYVVLVKLVLYVGFTFSCLATNYTSVLLNILAGKKWGNNHEATAVLSAFCIYTAFLAWNGMTEAFVYGVATSGREIGRMGIMHAVVGVIFAIIAPLFVNRFGTVGLVAANCIAMLLRSIYSVHYAATYFALKRNKTVSLVLPHLLVELFPHWAVILAFAASAMTTRTSLTWMNDHADIATGSRQWFLLAIKHVAIGGLCFAGVAALAFTVEKDFRRSIRNLFRAKDVKED
jgi:oligosaccharide translocation protein RFT1